MSFFGADILLLCRTGITVAMVIHQPRVEIWNSLDDLLLLAPGIDVLTGLCCCPRSRKTVSCCARFWACLSGCWCRGPARRAGCLAPSALLNAPCLVVSFD
jgi:NAD(P)H-hydrate repair Nnr-like enzyme with NAD(P)H-hydrate dehydratase domain